MRIKKTACTFFSLAAITSLFFVNNAVAGLGSCKNYQFLFDRNGKIDRTQPLTITRQGARIYSSSAGSSYVSSLSFNKKLKAIAKKDSRIQVSYISSKEPLGWVDQENLLCAIKPLKGASGLERKLYIKTATAVRGSTKAVNAYTSYDHEECPSGGCRELSRFTGYFIFDEENGRYLLSNEYNFQDTSPLTGWVDNKDGFLWDTAYGLRPKEKLVFGEGHRMEGEEKSVCAYLSLEDAKAKKDCRPILGGKRWYRYPDRIPILGREGKYYKVALPLAGGQAESNGNSNELTVNTELFGENKGINQGLLSMKRVDVFFLIDGTSSMQPYIDAVQGVVKLVLNTLSNNEVYRETKFRFGFRIYRDNYAGNKGIGEGLPLPSNCNATGDSESFKNREKFEKAINRVAASSNDNDDYEENVFGGIKQAVKDLIPCSDNTKILFVIGDHGYNGEAQRNYGNKVVTEKSLINRLKGNSNEGEKNIVTFFVQTPDKRRNESYNRAYRLFTKQSKSLLKGILKDYNLSNREINEFLLKTDDRGLPKKILDGIKKFSRGDVINEVVLDLRGGASLVDTIKRLQGSEEYGNLPGFFWDVLKDGTCKNLGTQCENKKYDTILEGYIPVSDDTVEDVWLKAEDLTTWKDLLSSLKMVMSEGFSGSEKRQAFVIALTSSLQRTIGDSRGITANGEPLQDYLKRSAGLPVRDNSPLFQYSYDELLDKSKLPDCELSQLGAWVNSAKEMLDIVSLGTRKPDFQTSAYPGECRRPNGSAISIPFIDGAIGQTNLGPTDKYRYDHAFQKVRIYWVPKEYLP